MKCGQLLHLFLNIPIAHLFGGETSYGSQDETIDMFYKNIYLSFVTHKLHKKELYKWEK